MHGLQLQGPSQYRHGRCSRVHGEVAAGWGHFCFPACPLVAGSLNAMGGAQEPAAGGGRKRQQHCSTRDPASVPALVPAPDVTWARSRVWLKTTELKSYGASPDTCCSSVGAVTIPGDSCFPQLLKKPKWLWILWKMLPLFPPSHWKLPSSLGWQNRDGNMDLSHREPGTARVWQAAQGRGTGAGQSQG